MKRSKLLVVALLSLLLFSVAACDGAHLHDYGKWSVTTAPTWEEEGVWAQSCSCGHTIEEVIPALSNTDVWALTEEVEPTHAEEGKKVYSNEVYGNVEVVLAVVPHVFGEYTITVDPTLSNKGEATHKCECGHVETVEVPALSDDTVWASTVIEQSTHFVKGSAVYTSVYGEVTADLDLDPTHVYGEYTITVDPTAEKEGKAVHSCECGHDEEVSVPVLTDAIWEVTTVPSTHLEKGKATYVSVYGTVEVELDFVPHEFGEYSFVTEPTLTTAGQVAQLCGCGTFNYTFVPALTDAIWAVEHTTPATYNEKGIDTYTSVYGSVEVATAKIVAPYDNKTYSSFNLDASADNGFKNGVVVADDVWSSKTITLDAEGKGSGDGYPFRGAYKFVMVNAETGEVLVKQYSQKTEEVWVPDEESMDPEAGYWQKVNVTDEDGNPVYDWEKVTATYTAWVDMATGLMVAPRNTTFDDVNVYTPYEIGFAAGSVNASAWDNAIAIEYSIGSKQFKIFVYDGRAYFGVKFVDLKGYNLNVEECYNAENVHVKDANGDLIAGFAFSEKEGKLVVADGFEGTYKNGSDTLTLNGCGVAELNGVTGEYVASEGVIGLYVNGEYFEITLSDDTYSSVKPMVTITFEVGEYATVEAIEANKNIAIVLPAPTNETHTFKGWYLDSACTNAVALDYLPTESVTLYALWKQKITINIIGVLEGDEDSILLGDGDVIGDFLPVYGVNEEIGKVFRGWYLDAEHTVALPEEAEVVPEDTGITVYAKWEDLPAYYGTYSGSNLYSASSGNSGGKTIVIDEMGNISGQYSGYVESYDEELGMIYWRKSASDTNVYLMPFNKDVKAIAIAYSGQKDLKADYYFYMKHSTTGKVNTQYAVQTAPVENTTNRAYYARFVNMEGPNGAVEALIYGNRILSNIVVTDAEGNALTAATVKNSKVVVVKDLNGNIILAVASTGESFAKQSSTVDLDAYFGTYVNGEETVVLDGVGGITYGEKSGTYTAVEGQEYGFDVYLENNGEYYQLTLNGESSFTMVKPMVTVSFEAGEYATVEAQELNVNVAHVLPVPTHETNVFNGWFYDAECTQPVGESIVPTQTVTLHALWKVKAVLTLVYNNGEEDGAIVYSIGDTAEIQTPVKEKHAFVGWFTTEDCVEGSEWTSGAVMEGHLTIYAKWEAAPIYNDTYSSFEIDRNEVNGGVSGLYARNAIISIDPYGKAPKGSSWPFASGTIEVKNFNAETGYIELHVGTSSVYWGYIDAVTGFMVLSDTSGAGSDMDEIIFMGNLEEKHTTASFTSSYWAAGMARTIQYVYDGTTYSMFVYNNNVYFGVTFTDAEGNAISAENCYNAALLFINGANGELIAKFGYDGTTMQPMDGFEGTYTVADGEIVVDGVKTITIGGVAGEYVKAQEGAEYTHDVFVGGCYYQVTLNVEGYTAVVVKPMATIIFDAGEMATLEAVEVNVNVPYVLPVPENDAYIFRGWYFDAELTDAVPTEYIPQASQTLYAKWDSKVALTVVYGNGLENVVLYYGVGDITAPEQLTHNGLYFGGWYLDADLTQEYTVGAITENTTIYCKWVETAPYTFKADGAYTFVYDAETGIWKTNNQGANSTTAGVRITAQGTITVSFDYSVSSESGWDKLYVYHNATSVAYGISGVQSYANFTVTLEADEYVWIYYKKDSSGNKNDDTAYIKNLTVNGVPVTDYVG